MLVASEFEDLEVFYPLFRLREEGYEVVIASSSKKTLSGKHGYTIEVNATFEEINPEEFDGLYLPGGRGPERIRIFPKAIEIVKHFLKEEKPIGAICHGPQLLISTRMISGRKMTGYRGIRDDLIIAGVEYRDAPVVVDKNIVTSRVPSDLPENLREFIAVLRKWEERKKKT